MAPAWAADSLDTPSVTDRSTAGGLLEKENMAGWNQDVLEGDRLLALKELAKAQKCYERAYEQLKKLPTRSDDDFVFVIEKLADSLYRQDIIDDTIPLHKKALKVLEKAYGKESSKLIPILVSLGTIYEGEGDFSKAEKRYMRADRIASSKLGPNSLVYADTQHRLGRTHSKMTRFRDADREYYASLQITMRQERLSSSDFLEEVTNDYINFLRQYEGSAKNLSSSFQSELLKDRIDSLPRKRGVPQSNWNSAVSARLADQAANKVLSPNVSDSQAGNQKPEAAQSSASTPTRIAVANQDSEIYTDKKFSDFAALEKANQQRISFYERMIAADIDALGREHPSVARDLTGLASIYISQRNYDNAKPLLARSVEIYEKIYQGDSAPAKQARRLLAVIAEEQNPSTIALDATYIEHLPRIPLEAQKLEIAYELNDLAFMLYCQGKIARSLTVYYWALASTANSSGPASLLSAACMNDIGKLLRMTGKNQEAEQFEGNARAILRRDLLTIRENTWKR